MPFIPSPFRSIQHENYRNHPLLTQLSVEPQVQSQQLFCQVCHLLGIAQRPSNVIAAENRALNDILTLIHLTGVIIAGRLINSPFPVFYGMSSVMMLRCAARAWSMVMPLNRAAFHRKLLILSKAHVVLSEGFQNFHFTSSCRTMNCSMISSLPVLLQMLKNSMYKHSTLSIHLRYDFITCVDAPMPHFGKKRASLLWRSR